MQCNVMQHNVMYVWYGMIWSGLVWYVYIHICIKVLESYIYILRDNDCIYIFTFVYIISVYLE